MLYDGLHMLQFCHMGTCLAGYFSQVHQFTIFLLLVLVLPLLLPGRLILYSGKLSVLVLTFLPVPILSRLFGVPGPWLSAGFYKYVENPCATFFGPFSPDFQSG